MKIKIDNTITVDLKLEDSFLNKDEVTLEEANIFLEYLNSKFKRLGKLQSDVLSFSDSGAKTKIGPWHKWTLEDKKELIKLYKDKKMSEIKAKWGLATSTIYNKANRYGKEIKEMHL